MGLSRREFIAAAGGAVAAAAGGPLLWKSAWPGLTTQDLVPGSAEHIALTPRAWTTTADRTSIAVVGDHGSGGRQEMAVAASMADTYRRRPFGTVAMLGDISYYGTFRDRHEAVFDRPMRPLVDAGVRFDLALGNHDEGEAERELLGLPGRHYSVPTGPAELFYLDTSTPGRLADPADQQLEWLDGALAASERQWRIVAVHHPPYSSGHHRSELLVRELIEPIVRRHRVDLVLAGHDHHYERTVPIDGVTYVVSGGGCKPRPTGSSDFTVVVDATLQFLHLDIDGDRLTGRAVRPDGSLIDTFGLRARSA